MIHEAVTDILGDFPGWLALFIQAMSQGKKPVEAAKEVARQRMPKAFGFGREDERIMESLRHLLSSDSRKLIDLVISKMRDYEATIFRLTVTGMPCGGEAVNKPVANPKKGEPSSVKEYVSWEFMKDMDLRVKFLNELADEVRDDMLHRDLTADAAVTAVVDRMRARRLITRSKASETVYRVWGEVTSGIENTLLSHFGVKEFAELRDGRVAVVLRKDVERLAARYPKVLSIDAAGRIKATVPGVFSSVMAGFKFWR
jgi:hypothetical protein